MKVGLQLYTLHELDEPTERKLERAAVAGFEGVELNLGGEPDALGPVLERLDLAVAGIGITRDDLWAANVEPYIDACDRFDCPVLRMGLGADRFTTEEDVQTVAHHLDACADVAADHGLTLHYHNHDHEFVDIAGRTAYERLVEATDAVMFEVDAGWAGVAGVDPAALLGNMDGRVTHIHAKDMEFAGRKWVTFGEGDLDIAELVRAARSIDAAWLLFENDFPTDPIAEPSHASIILDQYTHHL